MSVLVVQIPPRRRLSARDSGSDSSSPWGDAGPEFAYALSSDGLAISSQGQAAAALLPRADSVVAVLADADIAWHRLTLPKAPAAKLRAALAGTLEEALLEDADALHFALAPGATVGQPAWVAVVHRGWLSALLSTLDRAGVAVDRVVPPAWPGDAPLAHFFDAAEAGDPPDPAVTMADVNGIVSLPLAGTLARALLPQMTAQPTRWTATPAVAAPAERWLGAPVTVMTDAERSLQAARSLWNLRQFDLAPHRRGSRAMRDLGKRFLSPAWRPVRLGLLSLVLLQVVGLNAWAWSQRRAVDDKRQAQIALLKSVHPQVRAILDAPVQMQRETESLRVAAGRPGDADFESMLSAVASAWPEGQGPAQGLRFEPGQLTLAVAGWTDDQARQFRERLRPAGWAAEYTSGRMTITRAAPAARGS